jgi:hypothetical protein
VNDGAPVWAAGPDLSRNLRVSGDKYWFGGSSFGYKPAIVRPALITAAACVLAAAAADPAAASSQTSAPESAASPVADAGDVQAAAPATSTLRTLGSIRHDIRWTRGHAVRKARRAALPIPRHGHAERHAFTRADLVAILRKWERRLDRYRAAYARRLPVLQNLLCIHTYEGSWDAVSATVPTYYGGLQMDASFEAAYGPDVLAHRGTHANQWPKHDQLMVGYRGYRARGYTPWPTAAAACGLI